MCEKDIFSEENIIKNYTVMRKRSERGQSLAIMTIGIIAFLAMLALVLDGGMAFANRRLAQKAADAGALAGAREMCLEEDPILAAQLADQAAREYAITRNGASSATVFVDTDAKTVDVVTTVPFQTAFAHLLGFSQITTDADAQAGCVSPGWGEGVLPTAWACQPPAVGTSTSTDCEMQAITVDEIPMRDNFPNGPTDSDCDYLMDKNYVSSCPPPPDLWPDLYIVMTDISTTTEYCMPDGNVNCDFDGDGENDLVGNGGREWLDLDGGGGGASELVTWINGGFPGTIVTHTWIPKQSGVTNSVFQAAASKVGEIVVIPVFDNVCETDPPGPGVCGYTNGKDNFHTDPPGPYADFNVSGTTARYYHIIGFAAFYVSCVDAAGVTGTCPGHDYAASQSQYDDFADNTRSVEGYFIQGFIPGIRGASGGVDTGAYVLKLTR